VFLEYLFTCQRDLSAWLRLQFLFNVLLFGASQIHAVVLTFINFKSGTHHCGLVNTEGNVKKLKNALQLSHSMTTIINETTNEEAQKKV
jgi:hypothetical protein